MAKPYDPWIPQWVISRDKLMNQAYAAGHTSFAGLARTMQMSNQNLYLLLKNGTFTGKTLSRLCYFCDCRPEDILASKRFA